MTDFVECGTVEAVIEAAKAKNRGVKCRSLKLLVAAIQYGGQSCFRIDNSIASGNPI